MKWQFKYMLDPGDGLVTTKTIEHPSDDLGEVATDIWNNQVPGIPEDEQHAFSDGGWLIAIECLGENHEVCGIKPGQPR